MVWISGSGMIGLVHSKPDALTGAEATVLKMSIFGVHEHFFRIDILVNETLGLFEGSSRVKANSTEDVCHAGLFLGLRWRW